MPSVAPPKNYSSRLLLIPDNVLDLSVEEHMSTVTAFDVTKPPLQEFGQIFEEHYDLTYRTAYGIMRRAEDAEDVVQTIFLQLLRREVPPDLTKNPRGYFYRAAVNLSLQAIRARRRHILRGDSEQLEASTESGNSDFDEEMDRRLWDAIAQLNEGAAQILILRYIHNYSLANIARVLGTTRSTVAVSLFRSRSRLKQLIRASQEEQGR
jgi:RNA polymerase sigma-70 factor (ECF subfamily)